MAIGSEYHKCDNCGHRFMPSKHETCPHCADSKVEVDDDGFKGYWYIDSEGRRAHTWDFEESIGE